jgi:hypothetical protein
MDRDPLRTAHQRVCDYLRVALQPPYLGLPTDDMLCAAESVWNNYAPGTRPPPFEDSFADASSPVFQALVEALHEARAGRFGDARFVILSLECEYEEHAMVFSCDLMWPEGGGLFPFRLRVSRHVLAPPDRN